MYHKQRWTLEKIKLRLELIAPLVYIKRKPLPSFRYRELEDALTPPQIGMDVDDSDWQEIDAHGYWGAWMQNFVLRTTFAIPDDWEETQPIALSLPLGEAGDFTRIFDKQASREVLAPDSIANQFQSFEDRPSSWDAWDIEIFYDDKMWPAEPAASIEVVEYGELRQTVEIKRRILNSEYTQRISLSHNSARLDFDTHITWNERHILLKVAFPVDVLAPLATYEIQWGNVQRGTHHNTSWDWARFETCAQKWGDLSEGDYGVSLLNDCKYGHDIHDHVLRLTLLRSPTMPDPTADLGEHQFKYRLYPHRGSWHEGTEREAYLLNDPIIVFRSDRGPKAEDRDSSTVNGLPSMVSVSAPNVIIETVKGAEDGDGIIVRLYESQRKRGPVQLRAGFEMEAAWETNLLEENESALRVENDTIQLDLIPYQIMTLRLKSK